MKFMVGQATNLNKPYFKAFWYTLINYSPERAHQFLYFLTITGYVYTHTHTRTFVENKKNKKKEAQQRAIYHLALQMGNLNLFFIWVAHLYSWLIFLLRLSLILRTLYILRILRTISVNYTCWQHIFQVCHVCLKFAISAQHTEFF